MRIHTLQHVPFETPGFILQWLKQSGADITNTAFFNHEATPSPDEIDWLVVMGGPMSVHDKEQYPWLGPEADFIRRCILGRKKVLGICLGAQLIAHALGARIFPNPQKEIGWFPITRTAHRESDILFKTTPGEATVFHWHGETFELPENAIHLASSSVCTNQAFLYRKRVMGLQFHLEMTAENVQNIVKNCENELVDAPYIQNKMDILSQTAYFEPNQAMMTSILEYLKAC